MKYIRIFAFWEKTDNQNTIVAATHGIYKKHLKSRNQILQERKGLEKNIITLKKVK